MRSIHPAHGPRRCNHDHPLRAETSDEDHGARGAARGLEGAQTLDSRHFHHQRGPGPRGDRKREEALRRSPVACPLPASRIRVRSNEREFPPRERICVSFHPYPNVYPSICGSRRRGGNGSLSRGEAMRESALGGRKQTREFE